MCTAGKQHHNSVQIISVYCKKKNYQTNFLSTQYMEATKQKIKMTHNQYLHSIIPSPKDVIS